MRYIVEVLMNSLFEKFLLKINTNSASLLIALVLSVSGISMCLRDLSRDGYIDIKSSILSGRLQTGSVGIIVIFFSTIIVMSVVRKGIKQTIGKKNEKIEIKVGESVITCENISYRKIQELKSFLERSQMDK